MITYTGFRALQQVGTKNDRMQALIWVNSVPKETPCMPTRLLEKLQAQRLLNLEISRAISRWDSFFFKSSRLSEAILPLPTPSSIFMRLPFQ
jgi:hypothetical protein